MVLQPDAPQISLSGVGPHLARPAPEFEGSRGVPLFPELRIVCSLSHAVNTAAQGMEGGGETSFRGGYFEAHVSKSKAGPPPHFIWHREMPDKRQPYTYN